MKIWCKKEERFIIGSDSCGFEWSQCDPCPHEECTIRRYNLQKLSCEMRRETVVWLFNSPADVISAEGELQLLVSLGVREIPEEDKERLKSTYGLPGDVREELWREFEPLRAATEAKIKRAQDQLDGKLLRMIKRKEKETR